MMYYAVPKSGLNSEYTPMPIFGRAVVSLQQAIEERRQAIGIGPIPLSPSSPPSPQTIVYPSVNTSPSSIEHNDDVEAGASINASTITSLSAPDGISTHSFSTPEIKSSPTDSRIELQQLFPASSQVLPPPISTSLEPQARLPSPNLDSPQPGSQASSVADQTSLITALETLLSLQQQTVIATQALLQEYKTAQQRAGEDV
ncbi:hypothetical protein M501DRAFT_1003369 [Patellaria atrata CBS 101060]|uniref:Uncharacterized protein n=1 Tax=Patellaria atrata CBS 101060 TaxID=1346257 RepID=A0A9P4SE08_9PEZI|nr:hypothetical protein M501DRAFT_1003369 [Patellaria atrata CBS 101060]